MLFKSYFRIDTEVVGPEADKGSHTSYYFWFCFFLESCSKALLSIREKLKLFANVPSGQYFLFLA